MIRSLSDLTPNRSDREFTCTTMNEMKDQGDDASHRKSTMRKSAPWSPAQRTTCPEKSVAEVRDPRGMKDDPVGRLRNDKSSA